MKKVVIGTIAYIVLVNAAKKANARRLYGGGSDCENSGGGDVWYDYFGHIALVCCAVFAFAFFLLSNFLERYFYRDTAALLTSLILLCLILFGFLTYQYISEVIQARKKAKETSSQ